MVTKKEMVQVRKELDTARRALASYTLRMTMAFRSIDMEKLDIESVSKKQRELKDEYLTKLHAFYNLFES